MQILIWIGVLFVIVGLIGLGYCIRSAMQLNKQGLSEDEMKAKLQLLVPINFGSLGMAGVGFCCMIVGLVI